MGYLLKLLTVLGLGAVELWAAIPAGFAMQLHPVVTGIASAFGAILGAFGVLLLGERVKIWLTRRHGGGNEKKRHGRIYRIWNQYGVIGLGLSAPLLTGAPLGVALGLVLGAPAKRLLFWICLGIMLWSIVLTIMGILGAEGIKALVH